MLGISDAAETIGFRTIGVRITFEQLSQETALPCILHWNQNHFVVCYRIKLHRNNKATIYIADPASKKLTYDKDDFLKCWISKRANGKDTGIALMLQPTPTFSISDEECSSARHDLLFFVRYLLPYKKEFGQLILGMMVGSGLQLMAPLLTQAVVDKGIEGRNLNFIFLVLIAQLVIFFSQLSLQFVRSWLMLHVNTRIDISLISDFLAKLMRLPLRFFDTKIRQMKDIHKDNTELHCEEVQEIMGEMPSIIQLWGTLVIAVVAIVLFAGCFLFSSPETVNGKVMIAVANRKMRTQMLVVDTEVWKIKAGQKVMISLDRYPSSTYGHLTGYVIGVSDIPNQDNEYTVMIRLPHGFTSDTNCAMPVHPMQRGKGEVVVSNERLINKFIKGIDGFKPQ